MFGIGAYSVSETRAAEILTYLNTDAEVRNILQYGIEDVNYTLETVTVNEKDYVYAKATKDNVYLMDLEKTGNTLIAYPNDPDDVLRLEYDKKQNYEMIAAPTLGLNFSDVFKLDETSVRVMSAVSEKLKAAIDNMTTSAEVETLYLRAAAAQENGDWAMTYLIREYIGDGVTYTDASGATKEITNGMIRTAVILMRKTALDETAGALQSPYALYYDWCQREGVIS